MALLTGRRVTRRWVLGRAWRAGLALPLAGCLACSRQPAGVATPVSGRSAHTATLLPDGSILVVGGIGSGPLTSAQRVFPATGRWVEAGRLSAARADHTATLLPDGTVIVAAGDGANLAGAAIASAERFDPATGRWAGDASLATPRMRHQAVALADGTVLAIGGIAGWRVGDRPLATVERYDPTTRRWCPAAPLTVPRDGGAALRLADGRVLAIGGTGSAATSADMYDPASDRWTLTAAPGQTHYSARAALLADGRICVAGGTARPELYDPLTDVWTPVAPAPFLVDTVTRGATPDAPLLLLGVLAIVRFDAGTASWQAAPPAAPRSGGRAVPLPNGTIALVGGGTSPGAAGPPPLEIYRP